MDTEINDTTGEMFEAGDENFKSNEHETLDESPPKRQKLGFETDSQVEKQTQHSQLHENNTNKLKFSPPKPKRHKLGLKRDSQVKNKQIRLLITPQISQLPENNTNELWFTYSVDNMNSYWICKFCPETFATSIERHSHMVSVHSFTIDPKYPNRLKCEYEDCLLTFKNPTTLRKHLIRCHKVTTKSHQCPKCSYTTATKIMLDKHMFTHIKRPSKAARDGPKKCELCNKVFPTRRNLVIHKKRVHEKQKRFTCIVEDCDYKCFSPQELRFHALKHMPKESITLDFVCELCGVALRTQYHLTVHKYKKHTSMNERPYKCTYEGCSWRFFTKERLKHHEWTHSDEKPLICATCGKGFAHETSLIKHKNTVCEKNPEKIQLYKQRKRAVIERSRKVERKCPKCFKYYLTQERLDAHLKNFHSREKKKIKCDYPGCIKEFGGKYEVERHKTSSFHISELKPFECPKCKKAFASQEAIPRPIETNCPADRQTREKNANKIPCSKCKRKFVTEQNLAVHMGVVHDDSKLHCLICKSYTTSRQEFLDEHLKRKHTPKICGKKCRKGFIKKTDLYLHMKQIHSCPLLKCPNCSKTFVRQIKLDAHINAKHTGEEEEFSSEEEEISDKES